MKRIVVIMASAVLLVAAQISTRKTNEGPYEGWPEYLGGPDRNHYSSLTQINPGNVKNLKVAWSYETPEAGQMQVNPIIVDGVLFGVTSSVQAFALDAATGKEIWRFGDPLKSWSSTSRGVTYWSDGEDKRILYTVGPNLYALNAKTGKPVESFGDGGKIDLHTGLPEIAKDKFLISNTPGTLFEDLIIMPLRLSEDADAAPGDIRAFNVRTGKLAWTFHTIPYPGEFGYETFPKDAYKNTYTGAANNWAGMSVDRKRGIVYVPTGSAAYDFYGGNRKGANLFSNSLLALDAKTGKRIWHFQTTHHDIWDRDLPAPPNLITVTKNGKKIDAVAQVTKQGYVFVFDRVTGKPLFPIKEMPAPKSALPGEQAWPTQPLPVLPAPFARQAHTLTEKDISPYAKDRDSLIIRLRKYKKQQFAPPSKEGTVILPGFDGGAEWGGAAADPQEGILYVNSNEMAWIMTMVGTPKQSEMSNQSPGEKVYSTYCIACHGPERKGNAVSGYPSLVDIGAKRDRAFVSQLITNGKGMMPGFTMLTATEKQALVAFLFGDEKKEVAAATPSGPSKKPVLPYRSTGYNKFLDAGGLPAITPPWGTLNAIDLNTGKYLWKIPLGEEVSLKAKGINNSGTENYGGPVVTASGLLFIAATKDEKFRAFDKKTGKLLWETQLPAAGFATPSTYQVNGKQYIVIACGGTKLGTKKGNQYVAFALPD
ncbi:PQQ-binding-like beta-propeller repeat protein [Emticicia sp. CRIBPO]|uniref:outer membrane protein assembly factor BamB family protein n=1 Tax=Emticicia sp. CRIBPO TaxID=2683258 RepID=UPI001412A2EE|nr:PQQ-binding-like beta-propeller repeat protein [Emticicia sp. CRIBPO]NBA88213.1 PQQ-binding-like beta-propeller repeat protein [Emticicia sp. CRIBPO]